MLVPMRCTMRKRAFRHSCSRKIQAIFPTQSVMPLLRLRPLCLGKKKPRTFIPICLLTKPTKSCLRQCVPPVPVGRRPDRTTMVNLSCSVALVIPATLRRVTLRRATATQRVVKQRLVPAWQQPFPGHTWWHSIRKMRPHRLWGT